MAARRTERLIDHATMPRQASTDSPMKPKAAPTAMKTVPSGTFDFCMYGALVVGGTVATGISYVKLEVGNGGREFSVEVVEVVNAGRESVVLVFVVNGGRVLSVEVVASVVWDEVAAVSVAVVSVAVLSVPVVAVPVAVSVLVAVFAASVVVAPA